MSCPGSSDCRVSCIRIAPFSLEKSSCPRYSCVVCLCVALVFYFITCLCVVTNPDVYSTDLYFLIKWLEDEEDDLYDVLPTRRIKAPEGTDILYLMPGQHCQAYFNNILYSVDVVANGVL